MMKGSVPVQPAAAPLCAEAPAVRPRLGFVGLGWIGRMRLRTVQESGAAAIAAILDMDAAACDEARAGIDSCAVCGDYEELLDHDLDGVVIATPNACHAEQAMRALARGLPVFCQKPLATTCADVERVVNEARKRDAPLAADLCYRRLRGVERATQLISSGALGDVHAIDLTFHNAYGPDKAWFYDRAAAGGGCLLDLGVHLLDLAYEWTGGSLEIKRAVLKAGGRQATHEDVEEFAWADLRGASGEAVRLACSWNLHAGQDCLFALDVFGGNGSVRISNISGSFYDFETRLCRGPNADSLVKEMGDWGGRALDVWIQDVQWRRGFDEQEGWRLVDVMRMIERLYESGLSCAS